MQPFKGDHPCGPKEVSPENAQEFKDRISELLDSGADEVRVSPFQGPEDYNKAFKRDEIRRKERRKLVKKHRNIKPTKVF